MRRRRPRPPIERADDGSIHVTLEDNERELLLSLIDQLEGLLAAGPEDPRLRRLYPTAYHQDPEHDTEYRSFMSPELHASRLAGIATTRDLLARAGSLGAEEASAFMTVLNSLRLVLGTILDVGEGDDPDPDPDDPMHDYWQLYGYLGWLLEWTVEAMSGS